GLEALSRGAAHVTFIDQAREAVATAKHNAERMHEEEYVDFILADASQLGKARNAYSLVFLDPPYFSKLIPPTLTKLRAGNWLADDALVVIEHDEKEKIVLPEGFTALDERHYGRAVVELVHVNPAFVAGSGIL